MTHKGSIQGRAPADAGPAAPDAARASRSLGPDLRRLRRRAGMTLERLAELSGVSRAMLSSVERGDKNPTLPVLAKIAAGLAVPLSALMGGSAPGVVASVTARRDRLVYRDPETGIERHLLSPTHLSTGMEVVEHVLPPGQAFAGAAHLGVRTSKIAVVVEGQLTLEIGNVIYVLDVADSITFEVTGDYRFRNGQPQPCRYYLFMTHQRVHP